MFVISVVVVFFRLRHAVAALHRVRNFIDDEIGARVVQNQMTSNESVLKVRCQIRQQQEKFRRHRPERVLFPVRVVDVDVELPGVVVHDRVHRDRIGARRHHALQLPFHGGDEHLPAP